VTRDGSFAALRMTPGRWGKYLAVGRVTVANQTAYLGEMLVRTIFLGLILYVFVQLWTVTYEAMGRQSVAGFSVAQMVWYLMVTESILLSRPRMTIEIDQEVRAGDVAYQLIRPYDYVLFRLAAYLGERLLRIATCLAVGAPLAFLYVGPVPFDPAALGGALALLALGLLVDFAGSIAIGLCAFWVEDTQPLTLLYDRSIMLLGGLLLPLELFPDWIASILAALPFQLLLYAPARMVVSGDVAPLPGALLGLGLTLALVYGLVRIIYARAVRRLHAHGG
jgi:ABC-2 type transport system permease protein